MGWVYPFLMQITPITDTGALAAFCDKAAEAEYVTVDTEFIRDKTYWSKLCLIQLAGPDEAVAVDVLAPGIDLTPVDDLLSNPDVLKVFHAGRQDVEIFFHRNGVIPAPIFDSQVAAMVCGFGDQVGYETLISKLVGVRPDKSSRFTDWAQRPLSQKQLDYALADVIHLRPAYEKLSKRLQASERTSWLDEEMRILINPATYEMDPANSWKRIKSRNAKPRTLAIIRELAACREIQAQKRDVPRNRVLRDEAILEIAAQAPKDVESLSRLRGFPKGMANGATGALVLEAVQRAVAIPTEDLPPAPAWEKLPGNLGSITDLLRVLLKHVSEQSDVATKLIASADDLQRIAADDNADVPAMSGWRRELFGAEALALKHGRVALTAVGKRTKVIHLNPADNDDPPATEPIS
jgi:ribonuclease D